MIPTADLISRIQADIEWGILTFIEIADKWGVTLEVVKDAYRALVRNWEDRDWGLNYDDGEGEYL